MNDSLLREGETCWRVARADRVAYLIDGEKLFGAIADALENARHSVWLLGWDFHSAVRLRRGGSPPGRPDQLVPLLDSLVRERRGLHVHVLAWDFAMLYALEREFLPLLHFGAKTHRRVHFAMDSAHPLTASQHQKLVVVDDAIAFAGGFDLTTHRWDTREHLPDDPRRVTPAGKRYQPFHDVQIAVDGAAAAALGELARQRWRRATGKKRGAVTTSRDPWPASLTPDVRDVDVGIARTLPGFPGQAEVREVEALYRASIAAARRWIYVENQYLTSQQLARWLAERLEEPDGPEVLYVGPRENSGWLEESTMGALRDRAVRMLEKADRFGRLRVLYPHVPGLPDDQMLNVHSKVMVVDDEFARIGSANLSNRSMGLDTECDVAFEARGDRAVREAIAGLRDDLLAEYLGTSATRVNEAIGEHGSLVRAVDALCRDEGRSLRPIECEASDWTAEAVDAIGAIDPEHPVPLEEILTSFEMEAPASRRSGRTLWSFVGVLGVVAAFALAWKTTPLGEWLTPERLAEALAFLREPWYGPLVAGAIFVALCVALVPLTALTVAVALALPPVEAFAIAWLGGVAAAGVGHAIGGVLWRDAVRRVAGPRLNQLSRRLGRSGVVSTALLRLVPVAPYMVVNLVAGASHVRARDFLLGTALGLLPGTLVLVGASGSIRELMAAPTGPAWLWAAVIALAVLGIGFATRRLVRRSRAFPVPAE